MHSLAVQAWATELARLDLVESCDSTLPPPTNLMSLLLPFLDLTAVLLRTFFSLLAGYLKLNRWLTRSGSLKISMLSIFCPVRSISARPLEASLVLLENSLPDPPEILNSIPFAPQGHVTFSEPSSFWWVGSSMT